MQQTRHKVTRFLRWVVMVCILTSLIVTGNAAQLVRAEGPNHATLLVVFGPDDVYSSCISFNETEISGSELLVLSGLPVLTQAVAGMGVTVCKIDGTGCDFPGESCFCQCLGAPCNYWSYWTWRENAWFYAGRGASQNMVRSGDINAWVWGDGQTSPPVVGIDAVCGTTGTPLIATNTPVPPQLSQYSGPYPSGSETATEAPVYTATPEPGTATPETGTATPEPSLNPQNTTPVTATGTVAATPTPQVTLTRAPASATPAPTKAPATPTRAIATPDRSASVIAKVATNRSQTAAPIVAPEAVEKRSYWAFAGIALLLLLAISYALLLRRQRMRGK